MEGYEELKYRVGEGLLQMKLNENIKDCSVIHSSFNDSSIPIHFTSSRFPNYKVYWYFPYVKRTKRQIAGKFDCGKTFLNGKTETILLDRKILLNSFPNIKSWPCRLCSIICVTINCAIESNLWFHLPMYSPTKCKRK